MADVLVVGAGVIGLTSAVTLAEAGHDVTVRAREVPGRTSVTAAAIWGRYLAGPVELVRRWGDETLRVFEREAQEPGTGVRLLSGAEVSQDPDFANPVEGAVAAEPCASLPEGFRSGWRYTAPVIDMPSYMEYLFGRLSSAGGVIEQESVPTLLGLGFDFVVNCTGIEASNLVDDPELVPVRGQLLLLRNPGIDEFFIEDPAQESFAFWLPHGEVLILGGVAQPGRSGLEVDSETAKAMLARAAAIEPKLADAEVIGHRVGLRPSRAQVRLEAMEGGLVHNYGHGGAGVSLAWGCAAEVARLIG